MIYTTINSVKQKFENKTNLKHILVNVSWLFFDKILRLGLGFVLTALVARYLGAEQFGLWNYAIAFVALFSVFSTLGLDSMVVKKLVNAKNDNNEVLGAAYFLKLAGGIAGLTTAIISIRLIKPGDALLYYLVLIGGSGFIFQAFEVIDHYFQSILKAKNTVYARNLAFIISGIAKISIIYLRLPLLWLVLATLLELALVAIFLIWIYHQKNGSILRWRLNGTIIKELLKESLPLLFSTIVVLIYMRTDQIMLGNMIGNREVGIFSAAVRLSEAWYFIPLIITNSIFPAIVKAKENNNQGYLSIVQKSLDVMALLGLATALVITFIAADIIHLLYGAEFAAAGFILTIHTWTSVFVCLGFASGNWFIMENLQKYVFYRTAAGAVINVGLNYFLIPRYGGVGAALATLLSQIVASYFFNLFHQKTRPIFKMQSLALLKISGLYFIYKFAGKSVNS